MKAWQLTSFDEPISLNEVAEPTAAEGEVVIDVKATGLCHSDLSILDGDLRALIPSTPLTLGHEFAGVIAEVGAGVEGWTVGDRVGYASQGPGTPGVGRHGGYAEKVAVPAENLVAVPEEISFVDAAAGTDAGATSWNAVRVRADVQPGEKVAIIGLGGLGMIGARVAVLAGCEVYAAEPKEDVWPLATDLGIREVVGDAAELARFEPDVIIDFAGFGTTTAAAIDAAAFNGRIVQVGNARPSATIDTQALTTKNLTLMGMITLDSKRAVEGVYELLGSGQLQPHTTVHPFDAIDEGLEKLRQGKVAGRLVATLG